MGGIAAVSQLRPKVNICLIPSSYGYRNLDREGAHPLSDPLASSRDLRVVHHGSRSNRLEKIKFIAQKDTSLLELLIVCNKPPAGHLNCGMCEKCLRTKTALKLLGYDIQSLFQVDTSLEEASSTIIDYTTKFKSFKRKRLHDWIHLYRFAIQSTKQSDRLIALQLQDMLNKATAVPSK